MPGSLAVPSISLNNTDLNTDLSSTLNSKVDTTSAQTIGGNKTFTGTTTVGRLISKADGAYGTIRRFPIAANGESSVGLYRNNDPNDVSVAGGF